MSDDAMISVLVVEDNHDTAWTTATLLTLWGHAVRVARGAAEALNGPPPDAVVLDLQLPGVDGWEVARRLRARSPETPPFIIAMSGRAGEADRRRSEEAGIDVHLAKPADPAELRDLLAGVRASAQLRGAGVLA